MATANERELRESQVEWAKHDTSLARKQLSRRTVMKASAAGALLTAGGMSALLGACGDDSGATATATSAAGGGAAATGTAAAAAFKGVTGDWDTTGTSPYRRGLPDDQAKIDPAWKQYPFYYKYSPQRINWGVPVTRGGTLKIAGGGPANWDPMFQQTRVQLVYNKLYSVAMREGVPPIAPAFENELAASAEHTPDYTGWTMKLPPNVKFHNKPPVNGRALTADDVVFSFQAHLDKNPQRSGIAMISRVEAVDPTTVKFTLKTPTITFPIALAERTFVIFAREAYENQDDFKRNPVGSGPWVLESSQFQGPQRLNRNKDYWQKPPIKPEKYGAAPLPMIDRHESDYFANVVGMREAFFNGQVDHNSVESQPDPATIKQYAERVPDANINMNPHWSCCPEAFAFQMKNPLFQDVRVRRAVSLGINRQQIWEQAWSKFGAPGASVICYDNLGVEIPMKISEFGEWAQYNPEKAKALLKEAGLTPPIKFDLYSGQAANGSNSQNGMEAMIFSLRQAGVADVTQVQRDSVAFTQDQLNKSFPGILGGTGALPQGYTVGTAIVPQFLTGSARNSGNVSDSKLDEMLNRWLTLTDPSQTVGLSRQISQYIIDQALMIANGFTGGMDAANPWLYGARLNAHSHPDQTAPQNSKYYWMGEDAPGGRGGKKI